MESEKLPETKNNSQRPGKEKKQNNTNNSIKYIVIGCGALLLVSICIGIILTVAGGGFLASILQNTTAIVEYNNTLVDERDKVITVLQDANQNFFYSLEMSDISDSTGELVSVTDEAENTINSTDVPNGAQELKDLNLQYIDTIREIISLLEEQTSTYESVYDIPDTAYDDYQSLLTELDSLNVEIAEKLNEIVGYDAVPQDEIEQLKSDL